MNPLRSSLPPADVVLVNPAMGGFEPARGYSVEPTGLLYVSRLLLGDYRVLLLDQAREPALIPRLQRLLRRHPPLCVGLSTSPGSQLARALALAKAVERAAPQVPIVFGGAFPSQMAHSFLQETSAAHVVVGEGERAFRGLVDALAAGRSPDDVPGVLSHGDAGQAATAHLNLDELPDIPFHLLRSKRYFPVTYGQRTVSIETSRGCPHHCGFCYNTVVHRSCWRTMSPPRVLEMVRAALGDTGVRRVYFTDDNLFADMDRARAIMEGLVPLGITWGSQGVCINDILSMDEPTLALLARSGAQGLLMGVQTASLRLQRLFGLNVEPGHALEVNRRLLRVGIHCWYFFMCGFPTETEKDLRESAALATRLVRENPLACTSAFFLATPFPGTFLHQYAQDRGWPAERSLADWASVTWNRSTVPWLDDDERRRAERMYFLSLFHDRKSSDYLDSKAVAAFGRAYRPLARYRMQHMDFRHFAVEDLLRRAATGLFNKA